MRSEVAQTRFDSAATMHTGPAPEPTSSAGGAPQARWPAAWNSSPFNVDCPAPTHQKVTTKPTRFVHPHSWTQPTKIPTFPHRQAEKSPQNQHVLFFHLPSACRRLSRRFRVCSCDWVRCTRSVGSAPLLIGCSGSQRVQRPITGVAPRNGCRGPRAVVSAVVSQIPRLFL